MKLPLVGTTDDKFGSGRGLMPSVTNHYLILCWPSSMSPYGVTRSQWFRPVDNGHVINRVISWKLLVFYQLNSFWLRGDIRHRTGSIIAPVTASCLAAPAISWTNVGLSPVTASDIHLRALFGEIPQSSLIRISFKITGINFHTNLPGTNEFTPLHANFLALSIKLLN